MKDFFRKYYYFINKILYSGNKYYCVFCDKYYRKFLNAGKGKRINVRCPGCGSLERHRLLYYYLKEKTDFFISELNILDISPIQTFHKKFNKLKNLNYTSIDLKLPYVTLHADLTNLPFEDNYFDCIICYHVLEHIEDDLKALSEMFRVLKKDGWAIIQSPQNKNSEVTLQYENISSPLERETAYGQDDHVRIYGRDFKSRIESCGFSVTEDDFINKFNDVEIKQSVLDKDELINFCRK